MPGLEGIAPDKILGACSHIQIVDGSFSALSMPIFAIEGSLELGLLESSLRDLQNTRYTKYLTSQIFSKHFFNILQILD